MINTDIQTYLRKKSSLFLFCILYFQCFRVATSYESRLARAERRRERRLRRLRMEIERAKTHRGDPEADNERDSSTSGSSSEDEVYSTPPAVTVAVIEAHQEEEQNGEN